MKPSLVYAFTEQGNWYVPAVAAFCFKHANYHILIYILNALSFLPFSIVILMEAKTFFLRPFLQLARIYIINEVKSDFIYHIDNELPRSERKIFNYITVLLLKGEIIFKKFS